MGQHDPSGNDSERGTVLPERVGQGSTLELSQGEKFLIYRKREGISQAEMARRFHMKRRRYSEFEASGMIDRKVEDICVEPLKPHEKCLIWRRRSGWTQEAIAELMGITRYWLMLMETGQVPCDNLEAFWNGR